MMNSKELIFLKNHTFDQFGGSCLEELQELETLKTLLWAKTLKRVWKEIEGSSPFKSFKMAKDVYAGYPVKSVCFFRCLLRVPYHVCSSCLMYPIRKETSFSGEPRNRFLTSFSSSLFSLFFFKKLSYVHSLLRFSMIFSCLPLRWALSSRKRYSASGGSTYRYSTFQAYHQENSYKDFRQSIQEGIPSYDGPSLYSCNSHVIFNIISLFRRKGSHQLIDWFKLWFHGSWNN